MALPLLGTLLYLLLRRPQDGVEARGGVPLPSADEQVRELAVLASLHERGTIDDSVYTAESRRILGPQRGGAVPSQGTAPPLSSRT